MNRREFFTQKVPVETLVAAADGGDDPAVKPEKLYENKTIPGALEVSSTGLSEYSGTWGTAQAAHLLRRTTFGFNKQQLDQLKGMSMSAAVDYMLNIPLTAPDPPLNNYNNSNYTDPSVPLGQTWVNAPFDGNGNFLRIQSFKSWWIGQAIADTSIREKMVLFWHNHFSTETNTIQIAHYIYQNNRLIREYALGNFKTFVRKMTVDYGMLRYLNGYANTKTAPDENYGRELQELFTVGKGSGSHYTEDDVKAAARVLTGWRDNITAFPPVEVFDPTRHDIGNKQFSSFYNNTVIQGKSGAAGAQETDDLLNMIFTQNEVAKFICRKLYTYFVYYSIDADVENNVITPLSDLLISSNWEIKPVLAKLLKSDHFFDPDSMGCNIKSPVDFTISHIRQFNIPVPNPDVPTQYLFWNYLWGLAAAQQQDVGDPPNVAGWPAYYQEPQFYELWINSDTLPKRNQITDVMAYTGFSRGGNKMVIDTVAFADQWSDAGDPNMLIAHTLEILYAIDISQTQKDYLKSILLSGQSSDHYWTDVWVQYKNNPSDVNNLNMVKSRLQAMLKYMMDLAEYQLA